MVSPAIVQVKENIALTEKEKKIFNRLIDVLRHFKLETQLRVAGGWVRDKLLGKECYDIDIALDNMLGREFCEKVNEYLAYAGEEQQGVGVIQCNPDQSKHLETARMRIYDIWIDFVNLRSEAYVENSRIPTMKFGTAEEDAYRRDLTINSMFYNINTDSVEDLTGRGLSDLRSGLIVTPLPSKATFLDDPLRVLRAIRFGARFGFLLDEELKKAAADEEVKSAIAEKISRERIGHEIDLMMSGDHPVTAIKYICDLQLFWVVFTLPNKPEPAVTEECNRLCVCMDAVWDILQLIGCSIFSEEQRRLCLYAALFLPLRKSVYADNKGKKIPVTTFFFRNSLKLKASDAETVASLHSASETFLSLIPLIESSEGSEIADATLEEENLCLPQHSKRRILAGLLLRQIKDFWRVALMLSALLHDTGENLEKFIYHTSQLEQRRELFRRIENSIIKLDLENIWEMKPLLDGKAIMNVLQLKTGGPLVREWQQRVLKWQLAHPLGTVEECLDWIRQSNAKPAKLL
ncbi:tRNA nucleotidyltransferase cca2-like [Aristolochia californica]|uniref:tRNA nucleotidyltransferase cca2-like n=1 Tax=Aristolochia californica TaxID=171875 RepID=UPI0035D7BE2D